MSNDKSKELLQRIANGAIEDISPADIVAQQNRESVERRRRVEAIAEQKRNKMYLDEYYFDEL